MADDDEDHAAYFASLTGPVEHGTYQAARLKGPVRRTFATTPPGSRRVASSSPAYTSRERYWQNERPVLQDLSWSSIKTKVPEIPPLTEKSNIKSICLNQFVSKLKNARGDWTDKTEALASEFNMIPNLEAQAEHIIEDIDTKDSTVYTYQNGQILDANYTALVIPTANDFTADERLNAHWYKFAMDVDPFNINVGTSGINNNTFPAMKTFTIFIRAARDQATGLIPNITKAMFNTNPSNMVQQHFAHGDHWAPASKKATEAAPDPDQFNQYFAEYKQQVKFEVMRQLLKKQYVREDAIMETPSQRLLKIQQRKFDSRTKQTGYKQVSEVVTEFETILQEIRDDIPADLPNLSTTFVHALSPTLQRKLLPNVTTATPANYQTNVSNFNAIVERAITAEQENKDLARMIQLQTQAGRLQGPRRMRTDTTPSASTFLNTRLSKPAPRSAMAPQAEMDMTLDEVGGIYNTDQTETEIPFAAFAQKNDLIQDPFKQAAALSMPTCFLAQSQCGNPSCEQDCNSRAQAMTFMVSTMDQLEQAYREECCDLPITALSPAEESLRQASGMRAPIECFGCKGIKDGRNPLHLWKDCPHKKDPDTYRNFVKNLELFRAERRAKREQYPNKRYGSDWKRQGFTSKDTMRTMATIMSGECAPETRRTLIAAFYALCSRYWHHP